MFVLHKIEAGPAVNLYAIVTIFECLRILSACRLRSEFLQSTDCLCLNQILFSKSEQLNVLNKKFNYKFIYKFLHPAVNFRLFELKTYNNNNNDFIG